MKYHWIENYDEHMYAYTTKSGLKVIAIKQDALHTTFAGIGIPFGSCHLMIEHENQRIQLPFGSAHFYEHKIFASNKGDMFSKFVELGLDPNAMTTYDSMIYYFSATKDLYKGIDLLLETLDHAYFTEENIENERRIIQEEINMDLDDTMTMLYQKLYENLFHSHPIKYDILGTAESIKNITKKRLLEVHQAIANDQLRTLVITGNIDIPSLENYLITLDQNRQFQPLKTSMEIKEDPLSVVKAFEIVEMDISIPRVMLGIKFHNHMREMEFQKMQLSMYITLHALMGDSSTLYAHWLKNSYINQPIQFHMTHVSGANHLTIHIQTHAYEMMSKELEHAIKKDVQTYLNEEMFHRIKKVLIASNILSLDQHEHKMFNYMRMILKGISFYEVMDAMQAITYKEVLHYANMLKTLPYTFLIAKNNKISKI